MIEIEFTFTEGGAWYRTSVTPKEYAQIMISGLIEGKPITAVKLWYCEVEVDTGNGPEEVTDALIYDFILAKQGAPAWRTAL